MTKPTFDIPWNVQEIYAGRRKVGTYLDKESVLRMLHTIKDRCTDEGTRKDLDLLIRTIYNTRTDG